MAPRAVLDAGHTAVCEGLGIATTKPQAHNPTSNRASDAVIPPSLGGLPTAGNDNGDNGLFSKLDSLTGDDLEEALARLTADQQDRYYGSR